ncbi:MAG TPA: GNAT family N-acetyltransferase [Bacteroidia bacterium]|nr:GNAT family N-acetyltransferase [Bacteroidia bacterium]
MKFIRITKSNTHLLQKFLDRAGSSLETFRYFAKRPLTVVENHVATWVIEEHGHIEAYGHLDKEGETVWLGIAVTEIARGKGFGRHMMRRLMESVEALGLRRVKLSVDNINGPAIKLYRESGFELIEQKETLSFFEYKKPAATKAAMSTLAFPGKPVEEIIELAKENNFVIEFSSGLPFRDDMAQIFTEASIPRFAHNYFPAPKVPFVLNLGSSNDEIRELSINHCINGIQLSHAANAPFFSAHAGFCIDPKPAELGRQLSRVDSFDREMHWKLFTDAVKEILKQTQDLPTGFLLENNVLAEMNIYPDGSNPLLCVDAPEMLRFIHEINDARAGILLDTAHLKVSSRTMGFDLSAAAGNVLPHVRCIHHSDNDGKTDNNQPLNDAYWFLPFMREALHAIHVLEVRKSPPEALKKMEKILFSAD